MLLPLLAPVLWLAAPSPAPPPAPAPVGKKARFLGAKGAAARRGRPARRGQRARRPVYAQHAWTHEVIVLEDVAADPLDSFLRCHFTHTTGGVPPTLAQEVVATARQFHTRKVLVISGYRSPKYNLWLRKKGREVALRSQHTRARAIDFALPDVPTRTLYRHLLEHHDGGVGYYPITGFVHIDLGRKRTWRGT